MRGWFVVAAVVIAPLAAHADDAAPAPAPPAAKITFGAYIETYYSLNFALPSNRLTNLRGFDNRDRTFTLSNVALSAKGEKGPLTAIAIVQVGSTPSTYYLAEPTVVGDASVNPSDPGVWKYVQQATIAYAAPEDVTIQAGLFPSPIGPEVLPVKDNWNWSRSDLFFALPYYHAGVVVSRPLGGGFTALAHVYNGWNTVVDNNEYPSVAASVSYASKTVPAAQVMYFGGVERPTGAPEGSPWRHLFDAYVQTIASEQVSLMVHGDGGFENNRFGTSGWLGGALYGKVALTDKLYAAARADLFREWVAADATGMAAPIFFPTRWIGSLTATLALQPIDGLSVRIELRHDQADTDVFYGGNVTGDGLMVPYVPDRRSRDTLTLGATAWF